MRTVQVPETAANGIQHAATLALWTASEPVLSSQLDPLETAVERVDAATQPFTKPDLTDLIETNRHAGWAKDRRRIYDSMNSLLHTTYWGNEVNGATNGRQEAFGRCGASHWILRNDADPELHRVIPDHCHDRLCVPCGQMRAATIRARLAEKIDPAPHRFLTLTLKRDDRPLANRITRLYASFRRMRQTAWWKRHTKGGAAFLEITRGENGDHWHPHLHCILQGNWIDKFDLSNAWLKATGDSKIVKIKLIRGSAEVIGYVTKYVTKTLPSSVIRNRDHLGEAILALKGRRLLYAFGVWSKWKLAKPETNEGWTLLAHQDRILDRAYDGDSLAEQIMHELLSADPFTGEFRVPKATPGDHAPP